MKACVTISEHNLKKAMSIAEKFDQAEIRLDLCLYTSTQIKTFFSSHKGLIATYRCSPDKLNIKLEALKVAIESGAEYVDLEHDLDEKIINEMILFAKNYNTKVILSYHNYKETPSADILIKFIEFANSKKADYIKLSTKTNSPADSMRLMDLYKTNKNIICFGIGENSKYTRIFSLYLGAPFTYVYFGTSKNQIAEGQLSYKEFSQILDGFGKSKNKNEIKMMVGSAN